MTAPARRRSAAGPSAVPRESDPALWQRAAAIRREWLGHGLSTAPADRATAEECLARIYARVSRRRPRFEWVDSPYKALPLVTGLPSLDDLYRWIRTDPPPGPPPLASDLAASVSRLRAALGAGVVHTDPELSPARQGRKKEPWPEFPPLEALERGVPLAVVLHQGVRTGLFTSLATGLCLRVRAALAADAGPVPVPVCWYGQQDASWIGYYDMLRRLGLAGYDADDAAGLDDWAGLARSCGWWWPGEEVCVVVDRPRTVHTEPVPGARHDEVRARPGGVAYRDGWRPRV